MITATDVAYHPPPPGEPDWAETNFFGFHVPARNLCGATYLVARQGLGVAMSDVTLFDRLSLDRKDSLHSHTRQHLIAPDDLASYALPTGLRVRSTRPPYDYELSYHGSEGVEFDLAFAALMEPHDIQAGGSPEGAAPADILDTHFRGHFDLTGRVTGTLRLGEQVVAVDCVDTMDHSWGPRPERRTGPGGCWLSAHFSPERAMHCLFTYEWSRPPHEQYTFVRGYVLDDGEVHEVTEASMRSTRVGHVPVARELIVHDCRGRLHRLFGTAVSGTSVGWFAAMEIYYLLYRWESDGAIGHGAAQENLVTSGFTEQNVRLQAPGTGSRCTPCPS
ncbi:DUF7064 domain-containing protein [Nocardioides humi]|uniref:DUF7064 domain-containing protein n=1 Tax=Nocardioides humi TaxID=449461 RepID=A0ABN2ACR1_9ACTN|nr:hypothetical protein [Nocardioides humi]